MVQRLARPGRSRQAVERLSSRAPLTTTFSPHFRITSTPCRRRSMSRPMVRSSSTLRSAPPQSNRRSPSTTPTIRTAARSTFRRSAARAVEFFGVISGYRSGDQIKFSDSASNTLSYTTSYAGGVTTVIVKDGSATVGTVALSGNYTGAHACALARAPATLPMLSLVRCTQFAFDLPDDVDVLMRR